MRGGQAGGRGDAGKANDCGSDGDWPGEHRTPDMGMLRGAWRRSRWLSTLDETASLLVALVHHSLSSPSASSVRDTLSFILSLSLHRRQACSSPSVPLTPSDVDRHAQTAVSISHFRLAAQRAFAHIPLSRSRGCPSSFSIPFSPSPSQPSSLFPPHPGHNDSDHHAPPPTLPRRILHAVAGRRHSCGTSP